MSKYDKIVVQVQEYDKDRVYITLGYNFGFSLNLYKVKEEVLNLNPAASIFLAYYKQEFAKNQLYKNIEINVNPGNTFFSLVATSTTIIESVDKLLKVINYVPNEEFNQLKHEFIQHYRTQYIDNNSALKLTLLEFIAQNKRFNKDEFHKYLEALSIEDVQNAQNYLFKGMEFYVHALGEIDEELESQLREKVESFDNASFTESAFLPLSEQDIVPKKLIYKSPEFIKLLLIHTNPDNKEKLEDIFLTYQIINELYHEYSPQMIIDTADIGMIISNIDSVRINYLKENFISYINKLEEQFDYLLVQMPRLFSELFVTLWISGIDYVHYYKNLKNKSTEECWNTIENILTNSLFCNVEKEGVYDGTDTN
ncbi:hypothetical protein [Streptococcus oralis]|uniref:Uncharacterized protein n=1 Tax=Streptococcus oralis subsp. dentisani TaxID=1458253 RepID=A0A1X1J4D7_STROR|nr:hypothetical protein [Streptococcus oralis]ORO80220.1 hypothetical protein B7708_01035 [Streptococcus oralis subsp. dentisani]